MPTQTLTKGKANSHEVENTGRQQKSKQKSQAINNKKGTSHWNIDRERWQVSLHEVQQIIW